MGKTLQALLMAGALAGLVPAKRTEAQQHLIFSAFYGGGPPPLKNLAFNLHERNYGVDFESTQFGGIRYGRELYWDARVNPALEFEVSVLENKGKRINYNTISVGDTIGNCEFGEESRFGYRYCRDLSKSSAHLRMVSLALFGSIEVRPFQGGQLNRLAFYGGVDGMIRWSWFYLLGETIKNRNDGVGIRLGGRWRLEDENDSGEIFIEYGRDWEVLNLSGHKIYGLTFTRGGARNFRRTVIGFRGSLF